MFSHLHVHTEYSLLDGLSHIPSLVERARKLGMESLAITDHGALYGVIDFYLACREAGLKSILGCEIYLASNGQGKNPYHLVLLAKNQTGYQNLIQLVTKAHLEGFHYKPQVDRETLRHCSQGLVALSACPQGEVGRLLLAGRREEAARAALEYKDIFGDFYLEIQPHPIPEVQEVNRGLVSLSSELGLPLVATNDVHYVRKEDASLQDLLLCIQTNTSIYDEKRLKMAGDFFYLRSPEEMAKLFPELPQALANTQRIAEECNLELEFGGPHLPEVEVPGGKSADDFLAELAWQGLRQRYAEPSSEVRDRLSYELEVIRHTRFAHYFLVVWDIVSFARRVGILFGVRGSAAASLVLYCLNVTELDPLEHRLVFERFLNVERKEMPDIDLDFQDDRRGEVLSYITQRYGQDRVAQIITFGTLGAKAAIRDVGRALGLAYGQVDRVARLVPPALGMTLERALKESRELSEIYHQDETIRRLVDSAQKLEGTVRHASTHAAGVVISKEPLTQYIPYIPLQRPVKGNGEAPMTQFTMENIAQLGLLKMDILGLANLTILDKAKELIKKQRGIEIDLQRFPLSDASTFALLSSGETTGVFQLEGGGMRRFIRELKPSTFAEIAALVALYRPGPMEHIPTYIRAKQGLEPIRYPHPVLKGILEETYGVIVYQDQVLLIVQALAGYSLGEADIFRKAMGKKIPEVMKQQREGFVARAQAKGFSAQVSEAVFNLIEPFAGYAFNKAHSVSYAMLAYQTAYLKANFPAEYMTAFLNTYADRQDKVSSAAAECARLKLKVLAPDINRSQVYFSLERADAIRFGLAAIKNVGEVAVVPFLTVREEGGEFKSVEDLSRRVDLRVVGRRALESLIKVGAWDSLGDRGALLHNLERIQALAQREQRLKETGQTSLFNLWGEEVPVPLGGWELEAVSLTSQQKAAWEKELLGTYLSDEALGQMDWARDSTEVTWCGDIDAEMEGQEREVIGRVVSTRPMLTREGKAFVSAVLEDLRGSLEVTAWPKVYQESRELWQEGQVLRVRGRVRVRGEEVGLTCSQVRAHPLTPQHSPASRKRLVIRLSSEGVQEQDNQLIGSLLQVLKDFPGEDEVRLALTTNQGVVRVEWPGLAVGYCPELHERLASLVGEAGVEWKEVPLA